MDVGNPSNLARINHLFGGNVEAMRSVLYAKSFSDDETRTCIKSTFDRNGYILDPHGAVGMLALESYRQQDRSPFYGVVLETAHPSKFIDVYDERMKRAISVPERLQESMRLKKQSVLLSSDFKDLKEFLMDN